MTEITIIGEAFVWLRPEMTGFNNKVRAEVNKLSGATGLSPLKLGMAGIGAGVVAGITAATVEGIKSFSTLQAGEARLQGTMDITKKKAEAIGNAFLGTAFKSTFSGTQMMQAFVPVSGQLAELNGKALTVKQSLGFMEQAGRLAEATGNDLGSTTSALAQIMQAYHLKLKDAGDASAILYNVSVKTNTPMSGLSKTMSLLHGRLGELAPSLGQIGGLMLDAANHGVVGTRSIRALTSGLEHLILSSDKAGPALQKAIAQANKGVEKSAASVATAQQNLANIQAEYSAKSAPSIAQQQALANAQAHLVDVQNKLNGVVVLSTTQQNELADAQRRVADAQAKMTSSGSLTVAQQQRLTKAQEAVSKALAGQKLAQEVAIQAQKGGTLASASAQQTMAQLNVHLFDSKGKWLGLGNAMAQLAPKLKALPPQARELALANLFGAGAAHQLGGVMMGGKAAFDKATEAVKKHSAEVRAQVAYQHSLRGTIQTVRAGFMDILTVVGRDLNPVLVVLGHVIAGVTMFFVHNKVALIAAAVVIGGFMATSVIVLAAAIGSKLVKGIKTLFTNMGSLPSRMKAWSSANDSLEANISSLHKSVSDLSNALRTGRDSAQATADVIASAGDVVESATEQMAAAADLARPALERLGGAAEAAAPGIDALAGASEAAAPALEELGVAAEEGSLEVGVAIRGLIGASGLGLLLIALPFILQHWKQIWGAIREVALKVCHFLDRDVFHPIMSIVRTVVDWVRSHWKLLAIIFAAVLGPIALVIAAFVLFRKQTLRILDDVVGFFVKLSGRILGALSKVGSLLLGVGKSIIHGLLKGLEILASIWKFFYVTLPAKILLAVAHAATWLFKTGLHIMTGLWHGIEHGVGKVVDIAKHAAHSVLHAFTSIFSIFSPSKVMEGYGGNLMEGLGNGISKNKHKAESAMKDVKLSAPSVTASAGSAAAATRESMRLDQIAVLDTMMVDLSRRFMTDNARRLDMIATVLSFTRGLEQMELHEQMRADSQNLVLTREGIALKREMVMESKKQTLLLEQLRVLLEKPQQVKITGAPGATGGVGTVEQALGVLMR